MLSGYSFQNYDEANRISALISQNSRLEFFFVAIIALMKINMVYEWEALKWLL